MKTKDEGKDVVEMKSVETWASELETPDWLFAATKTVKGWGLGRELSKSEFEAALVSTANLKINP